MIPRRVSAFAVKPKAEIKPMKHQAVSLKHDQEHPVVYDASDAGTGKTGVRIWSFARRRKKGGGRMLVLAPRTLLRNAWENDFRKFAPHLKVSVATALNREKAFAAEADAYVTNHDAVKWLAKQKPAFFAQFDELVIDEPTAFKHKDSQRSRAAAKIRKYFKFRRGMSATPNSNGICDVWHQMLILDDGKRLGTSFYAFRSAVCEPKIIGNPARGLTEWHDKEGAEEAVFGLLADVVIRHKIEDCTDIPATHTYEIEYELPPKLRKAYDDLELAQLLVIGDPQTAVKVTAINAAAVATKLLQVCSGSVYDSDGSYHIIDEDRYGLVLDLIEARKHSLCMFQWKHQRDLLTSMATSRGVKYCVLDGDASDDDRTRMVSEYQQGVYQVMFGHPRSVAHGLTLTKGTSTIWPGPIYDLELWLQGNRRQARIGQKEKTEVITVLAKDTIEEKVYHHILMNKNKKTTNLLDLFSSMTPTK